MELHYSAEDVNGQFILARCLIECTACGEHNDYDSLLQVAKEKGVEHIKKAVEEHIRHEFKDLFKEKF
jgi:hypothetical protein